MERTPGFPATTRALRRRMRRRWSVPAACIMVAISLGSVAGPRSATATTSYGRSRELQAELDALVAAGAPGAILLVRDDHRSAVYTAGYGDVPNQTPIRPDDHFKIASLTKSYTASVVLQLVGEHRLRLSDSVERWLPGVVPNGRHIKVAQLLQHLSGLFDYSNDPRLLEPYLDGDLGFYWAPRQLIDLAVSHEPLYPPGQTDHATYSNTNYVLLGLIVEAITGNPIGEELQRRIFDPLSLDNTLYQTEPGLPSPYAHGYLLLGPPPALDVTDLSPSLSPASGAIVSTAEDVADFYRALLEGRVVKPKLLRQMKRTISEGTMVDIPGQEYGLGIEMFPTSCGPSWGHNGTVAGYVTFIFSAEDGDEQALLLVNHDGGTLPPAAAALYFSVLDEAFCSM
jgi:D-alanyl-D-alanine carboxypeptidase